MASFARSLPVFLLHTAPQFEATAANARFARENLRVHIGPLRVGCLPLLQSRAALFDQAQRYRHLWLRQTVFSEQALAEKQREHQELLDTILARDASAAGLLMREHLMTPVPIIRERLQEQGWV